MKFEYDEKVAKTEDPIMMNARVGNGYIGKSGRKVASPATRELISLPSSHNMVKKRDIGNLLAIKTKNFSIPKFGDSSLTTMYNKTQESSHTNENFNPNTTH